MAVTKTSLVSVFVVLAISFNQGAARPVACATKYGSSSSEESQWDCSTYMIPTVIKNGLVINITGEIDPHAKDKMFIVELSKSGKQSSCQFIFDFRTKSIAVKSSSGLESREAYDFSVKPGSEGPSFDLVITARKHKLFMMSLYTYETGPSNPLYCEVDHFKDIDQIDIKDGVARVNSLLFKFEE